jgi:hypothetical protein
VTLRTKLLLFAAFVLWVVLAAGGVLLDTAAAIVGVLIFVGFVIVLGAFIAWLFEPAGR